MSGKWSWFTGQTLTIQIGHIYMVWGIFYNSIVLEMYILIWPNFKL